MIGWSLPSSLPAARQNKMGINITGKDFHDNCYSFLFFMSFDKTGKGYALIGKQIMKKYEILLTMQYSKAYYNSHDDFKMFFKSRTVQTA